MGLCKRKGDPICERYWKIPAMLLSVVVMLTAEWHRGDSTALSTSHPPFTPSSQPETVVLTVCHQKHREGSWKTQIAEPTPSPIPSVPPWSGTAIQNLLFWQLLRGCRGCGTRTLLWEALPRRLVLLCVPHFTGEGGHGREVRARSFLLWRKNASASRVSRVCKRKLRAIRKWASSPPRYWCQLTWYLRWKAGEQLLRKNYSTVTLKA
jgi:hypothetical protein